MPRQDKNTLRAEDEVEQDETLLEGFDLDFSWTNSARAKKVHVFGQVQIGRGFDAQSHLASRLLSQPSRSELLRPLGTLQTSVNILLPFHPSISPPFSGR